MIFCKLSTKEIIKQSYKQSTALRTPGNEITQEFSHACAKAQGRAAHHEMMGAISQNPSKHLGTTGIQDQKFPVAHVLVSWHGQERTQRKRVLSSR